MRDRLSEVPDDLTPGAPEPTPLDEDTTSVPDDTPWGETLDGPFAGDA